MLNIDYVDDGSLSDTIIVKMDTLGMEDFIRKMDEGQITTLSAGSIGRGESVVVDLTEDVKVEVSEKAREMLRFSKPCHDYVDLKSGRTIMLSLNEYV